TPAAAARQPAACGKVIWLWACTLKLRVLPRRCSGLPVPFGAKFAAVASRGPLECATDIALCEPSGRFGAHSAGCQGGNMSEGVSPSPRGTRPGFSVHTHNLLGGLIVTILALLLLGFAFYVPNTVIPRSCWLLWPWLGSPRPLVCCPSTLRAIFTAASPSCYCRPLP